jgi:hypothetical protein
MKTNLLSISTLAVLAAAATFAESSAPVPANVSFRSIVANGTLKAGQNTISQGSSDGAVIIEAGNSKSAAIVFARPTEPSRTNPVQRLESNLFDWILGILFPTPPDPCAVPIDAPAPKSTPKTKATPRKV